MKNIRETIVMPIEITVSKGKCQGKYHHIGQKFNVDGQTPGGMCMGSFSSCLPYLTALRFGASFPWEKREGTTIIGCPDPVNQVVWRLDRLEGHDPSAGDDPATVG